MGHPQRDIQQKSSGSDRGGEGGTSGNWGGEATQGEESHHPDTAKERGLDDPRRNRRDPPSEPTSGIEKMPLGSGGGR